MTDRSRLLIQRPPHCSAEWEYVADWVFGQCLALDYQVFEHGDPCTRVTIQEDDSFRELTIEDAFFGAADADWLGVKSLPPTPLVKWSIPRHVSRLRHWRGDPPPVISGRSFGLDNHWEEDVTGIHLTVDILGSIFFMLTRYEEMVLTDDRDEHDRFPAWASMAYRENFLGRPIVDEYVEILWVALVSLWPGLVRRERQYQVGPTHDVDHVSQYVGRPWKRVLRTAAGDVVRRGRPIRALRGMFSRARDSYEHDPLNTFDFLMDVSDAYDLTSEFYFMTGDGRNGSDGTYSIDDAHARRLISHIHDRGHIIGYHASYDTMRDQAALKGEAEHFFAVMEELGIEQQAWGGRQHYLRFSNPHTWRDWSEAGFDYDSTLSYADHVGFRCGTCHEFPVYDLERRRRLPLRQRPLIVMEGTCLDERYMGLSLDQMVDECDELAARCRAVDGTFVLLWHNTSFTAKGAEATYQRLLERVCAHG